jgi:hypothetical protein
VLYALYVLYVMYVLYVLYMHVCIGTGRTRHICFTIIDTLIHHILNIPTNDAYIPMYVCMYRYESHKAWAAYSKQVQ